VPEVGKDPELVRNIQASQGYADALDTVQEFLDKKVEFDDKGKPKFTGDRGKDDPRPRWADFERVYRDAHPKAGRTLALIREMYSTDFD
jgi:hypothetical protein